MSEYSQPLGNAVRKARSRCKMTQDRVAELLDLDVRTINNIENYVGNPKMESLFPLIRLLGIDAREIFNPEMYCESASRFKLRNLIDDCSEQEVEALYTVAEAFLLVTRTHNFRKIE